MNSIQPSTGDAPLVSLRGVSFGYGDRPVLEDVDLEILPREAVCIIGPNGGGKTTLARLILGLIRPSAGEVRVLGRPPGEVRRRIGYMPQYVRFDAQFPISVLEVALMGRLGRPGWRGLLGWYTRADRRAALDALEAVGVVDLAGRPFSALSGGQRQRVLIARALCCEPELLLLDEPMAHVDTLVEGQLFRMLRQRNSQMAIAVVSHDLGFVSNLAEKVVCVNRRVVVHPTNRLTGAVIRDIYGGDVHVVDHGASVSHEGHAHG
jgi:zinc transport system ATP-binding protein